MPFPVASKLPQIALQGRPQSMGVFRSILPDAVIGKSKLLLREAVIVGDSLFGSTFHDISPCGLEFQRDAPTAQYLAAANLKRPLFEIGD